MSSELAGRGTITRSTGGPADAGSRLVTGRLGERLAEAHMRSLGFCAVVRNTRTREGEIDLIAFDGRTLAFVEVKTRRLSARSASAGGGGGTAREPILGLRPRQRARLRRLAAAWLRDRTHSRPHAESIRFDAIGVVVDERGALVRLEHVPDAW